MNTFSKHQQKMSDALIKFTKQSFQDSNPNTVTTRDRQFMNHLYELMGLIGQNGQFMDNNPKSHNVIDVVRDEDEEDDEDDEDDEDEPVTKKTKGRHLRH